MKLRPILLAAALLALPAVSSAKQAPHPDFTGLWLLSTGEKPVVPRAADLKLTPYGKSRMDERNAEITHGFPQSEGHIKCLPAGVPQMMTVPFGLQVMQSSDRLVMNAEVSNLPRTLFMRKGHPDDIDPSWNGDSAAHWEGSTLVVDTIGFNDEDAFDFNFDPPIRRTESLHLTERFSLEQGGKVLVDQMVLDDPKVFAKPVTAVYRYSRRPKTEGLLEYVCEVDTKMVEAFDAAHPREPKYKHPF